jgi:hypothetical protein
MLHIHYEGHLGFGYSAHDVCCSSPIPGDGASKVLEGIDKNNKTQRKLGFVFYHGHLMVWSYI